MCGIVGMFQTRQPEAIDRGLLHRMNEAQFHRGPDGGGLHVEPGLGLGHRRLSIIDLEGGRQPLYNEDQSIVTVFNGEIYNFKALAQELKQRGHAFQTVCDTEVIVHGWEEWGEECVTHFRGMFAFAVWDRRRELLFLARDRLGIKPLYYSLLPDGTLLFSSELKALMAHPGLLRELDPRAVEDYFAYGYVPDPKTILKDVFKLPPGHTLAVSRRSLLSAPRRYWDVPFHPLPAISEQDAAGELIERLREAVKLRMIADVPLGAFLSGGIDSSSVVAMMASLDQQPVKTCSISFGEDDFNEAPYARLVADRYRTDHRSEAVVSDNTSLIDLLSTVYDEPFADHSALPTYRLCELTRRHVTVALSGDGGDENFAGYRSYRLHMNKERIRSFMPGLIRVPLFGALGRLYPKADWAPRLLRAKTTFETLALDPLESFARGSMITLDWQRRMLFAADFSRQLQGYRAFDVLREYAAGAPTDDPLSLVQYLDLKTYLTADILTKVDRASMAHALEVRVPILDHKFVEWVSGLPPAYKYRAGQGKYIFRKALEPHLPREILDRRKMGFSIPLARWLRGPLRERVRQALTGSAFRQSGIFRHEYITRILAENESGRRDHSQLLWALLLFEAFQRQVLGLEGGAVGREPQSARPGDSTAAAKTAGLGVG